MKLRILVCLLVTYAVQASDIFLDIQYRDSKGIARWWKSNPDVKIVNKHGQTLLIKAVQGGNRSLVRRFLKRKISVNHRDDFGKTALDYAVEYEHNKIVLDLVKYNGMVTTQENLADVKSLLKSTNRFVRVISSFLKGLAYLCLIPLVVSTVLLLTCTIAIGGCGEMLLVLGWLTLGTAICATSFLLLRLPFVMFTTQWSEYVDRYNPNFITS